jgi:hypothetical protein
LKDVPSFIRALKYSGTEFRSHQNGWISLCNRIENLIPNPTGAGVHCDWQWGSNLVACEVLPALGQNILRAAIKEWPIRFSYSSHALQSSPEISFIFAHAGQDRLPQLCRTIRSIFAQTKCRAEVIVVDQSMVPVVSHLPVGIRYSYLNKQNVQPGWHKSWAFNVGARLANSDLLVFQDGDVCVPEQYAYELVRTLTSDGYQVASIQRMLFYLDKASTRRVEVSNTLDVRLRSERIFQNWKGGTIAIRRDAFFAIGGFDEGFVDWGGEDDEFYDRCSALKHCRFGYLPFIHLWHQPQPGRKQSDNPNISHVMPWRMQIPAEARIHELTQRQFGNVAGPNPARCYKADLDASGMPHRATNERFTGVPGAR